MDRRRREVPPSSGRPSAAGADLGPPGTRPAAVEHGAADPFKHRRETDPRAPFRRRNTGSIAGENAE